MKCIAVAAMLAFLAGATNASAALRLTEDFETLPLDRSWELLDPGVRVVAGQLTCRGPARAFWIRPQVRTYRLEFRYRHGSGRGGVILQASGEPPQNQEYRVVFLPDQIRILRRTRGQELAAVEGAAHAFTAGRTYRVTITAQRGRLAVAVDDSMRVVYTDPDPLPGGAIGFGCVEGSGFGFDDIVVQAPGRASPEFNPVPIPFPQPWAARTVDAILVGPSQRVVNFLESNPLFVVARGGGREYRVRGQLVRAEHVRTDVSLFEEDAVALPTADGSVVVVPRRGRVAAAYQRRAAQCEDPGGPRYQPLHIELLYIESPTRAVPALVDPCETAETSYSRVPSNILPEGVVLAVGLKIMNSWMGIYYCAGSGCLGVGPFRKGQLIKKAP